MNHVAHGNSTCSSKAPLGMTSAPLIDWREESLAPEPTDSSGRQVNDLRISVVETAADFAALRDEWNELLADSRSNCLFLTWEWLYTWWMHLGHGRSLFIITVRSGSQLIAIAPLTRTRARVGPLAIPLLEFAGTGSICSDYLDFIVRSTWERAATTLVSFLDEKSLSLRLPGVKEDSWVATFLSQQLVDRGWKCRKVPLEVCPFIDLSAGSWDSYLSGLRRKHRSNFTRSLRNLEKNYTVRLEYVDSEQNRQEELSHLVNLHLLRWRDRGGSSAFNNSTLLAFHDELSRLTRERGWLRLAVLKLDGKAAAALYGFQYGHTFHFFNSGFDPAFEHHSVGLVTLGLTIRNAFEEGAREYDLLRGSEAYKFRWANQAYRLVLLELYPARTVARMHWTVARVTGVSKGFAKRVFRAVAQPVTLTTQD